MTDQITVPRETWGAIRDKIEKALIYLAHSGKFSRSGAKDVLNEALTAANAVSEPKGLFVDLIASHGPEFVAEMADVSLTDEGDMPPHPQATQLRSECSWCETCRPLTIGNMRMIVCPKCGNKRCPRATHHNNPCTNSNDVGQKGSSWEHVKPAAPEQKP